MKIDHLTFGQLYKLYSHHNLCRVVAAYEGMLRRHWDIETPANERHHARLNEFSVTGAERIFFKQAAPWRRVIAFLKGSELRSAVRRAADAQDIPYLPGAKLELCRIPVFGRTEAEAEALAAIIMWHCQRSGAMAFWKCTRETIGYNAIVIAVETGPLGIRILQYRHGLPWNEIAAMCWAKGVDPERLFDWVPQEHRRAERFEDTRVNPCVWPMNTPDRHEIAKQLLAP